MKSKEKRQSRLGRRPRALTLVVLLTLMVGIVIANRIEEVNWSTPQSGPLSTESYGWPIPWYRYIFHLSPIQTYDLGWHYDLARLSANLLLWLGMLAAVGAPCERLLRRYSLRWRWSLRTMFTAVALLAALCAWATATRNLANHQDSVYAAIIQRQAGTVWIERWGPNWLDTIGADRFRRRVVGVRLPMKAREEDGAGPTDNQELEPLLTGLAKLPSLRYLSIESNDLNPRMAQAVANMRHLRILSVQHKWNANGGRKWCDDRTSRVWLRAIGGIGKLEHLQLVRFAISDGALEELAGLANLKSLSLENCPAPATKDIRESHLLERLPALPKLQAINLQGSRCRDRDLPALAALRKLTSLGLDETSITADALAHLAALASLEELEVDERLILEPTILSLRELRSLRHLHIGRKYAMYRYSPAMEALRSSHPELVIDGERNAISHQFQRYFAPPPVYNEPYDRPIRWSLMKAPPVSPADRAWIKQQFPEKALQELKW